VACRTRSSFGSQHRCDATLTFRDLNAYPELDERKCYAATGKRLGLIRSGLKATVV
jgi:hypothetical protein